MHVALLLLLLLLPLIIAIHDWPFTVAVPKRNQLRASWPARILARHATRPRYGLLSLGRPLRPMGRFGQRSRGCMTCAPFDPREAGGRWAKLVCIPPSLLQPRPRGSFLGPTPPAGRRQMCLAARAQVPSGSLSSLSGSSNERGTLMKGIAFSALKTGGGRSGGSEAKLTGLFALSLVQSAWLH